MNIFVLVSIVGQVLKYLLQQNKIQNLYNGLSIKEFRAVDPTSRLSISRIYSSATAKNVREFLKEIQKEF